MLHFHLKLDWRKWEWGENVNRDCWLATKTTANSFFSPTIFKIKSVCSEFSGHQQKFFCFLQLVHHENHFFPPISWSVHRSIFWHTPALLLLTGVDFINPIPLIRFEHFTRADDILFEYIPTFNSIFFSVYFYPLDGVVYDAGGGFSSLRMLWLEQYIFICIFNSLYGTLLATEYVVISWAVSEL